MALAIVIVSILVVYGAVMWVRPTARDRLLATLRMDAIRSGIKVQQCQIDDLTIEGRVNKTTISVVFYRRLVSDGRRPVTTILRTSGESGIYLPDGWTWENNKRLEKHIAENLFDFIGKQTDSIFGIEFTPGYVGICWDEKDIGQLKSILSDLETLLKLNW